MPRSGCSALDWSESQLKKNYIKNKLKSEIFNDKKFIHKNVLLLKMGRDKDEKL